MRVHSGTEADGRLTFIKYNWPFLPFLLFTKLLKFLLNSCKFVMFSFGSLRVRFQIMTAATVAAVSS